MDWKSRGYAIEHVLAGNDGVPTTNFKVIDAWSNGNAVSIKSLDLSLKSYQPPDAVRGKIYEYIDKLAPYNGGSGGGLKIRPDQITGRELRLAIPNGVGTPGQHEALRDAAAYGLSKGVDVNTIPVK